MAVKTGRSVSMLPGQSLNQATADRQQATVEQHQKMRTHKDLTVWQKSMELVEKVYKITSKLPRSEVFGLISQMQRSSVGIPSNIAEGAKREHRAEYIQFLSIANGSASELETQLMLTEKIYPKLKTQVETTLVLLDEILRMLYSLMKSLRN